MGRPKRTPIQQDLPTMDTPVDPAITAKAEMLRTVRSERMKLTKDEVKLVTELAALMRAKGIRDYVDPGGFEGKGVEAHLLVTKERVKVAKLTDEDEQPEVETQ